MPQCRTIIKNSTTDFGTSGVRGKVDELDDATVFAYTYAYMDHLLKIKKCQKGDVIWVGHDLRPSSPQIARACIAALLHCGLQPHFCGIISTPALAFTALSNKQAAIMVTGSHIPFDRNGLKFYRPDGELMKEDEAPIKACTRLLPKKLFNGKNLEDAPDLSLFNTKDIANTLWHARYLFAFPNLLKGMRIGHYHHSAAGRLTLTKIFMALGAQVIQLGSSNEFIAIDTEAVSQDDQNQAKKWVAAYGLDALISTDGDGDRPLLTDETGLYFRGDTLGILAAHAMGATTVITPISSNSALEKSNLFQQVIRTKIGSPHVIAAMQQAEKENIEKEEAKIIGFEANGGFLTGTTLYAPLSQKPLSALPTRDAVLPILATIALALQKNMKLSQLKTLLPQRFTASGRLKETPVDLSNKLLEKLQNTPQITAQLTPSGQEAQEFNTMDGLRMTFGDATIVHIRASGNAPELRIYTESDNEENANALLTHAKIQITQMIEQDQE